jgi:hypothetical protein
MIDLKHAIARVIVILVKGAPGDCISITPGVLRGMVDGVLIREALRLLRVLHIQGILNRVNGAYTLCSTDNPTLWAMVKRLPIDEAVAWLMWLIEDALDGRPIGSGPSYEL